MLRNCFPIGIIAGLLSSSVTFPATAQDEARPIHSQYGGVGLLKTRTARMAPDTTLAGSISWNESQQRYALTFQAAPWLETTFSYSGFDLPSVSTWDRQFDIKVKLWDESLYIPQVAVGLQDFLGTGIFSGEYIVASKQVGPLDLSFGAGWGRLGSRADAKNPFRVISSRFDTRDTDTGVGGEVNFGQFFKGESIGFFGGASYQTPIEGLQLVAEYNSDDNAPVRGLDDNPFNFGLVYNPTPGVQLTASYLGLENLNLQATFSAPVGENALDIPAGSPPPLFYVREENPDTIDADGLRPPVQPPLFTPVATSDPALAETLRTELKREGIKLLSLEAGSDKIRLIISNSRYRSEAKAIGRTTRVLSRYAPEEIETFLIAIENWSLLTGEFKLDRSILETSAREVGYSFAPPPLSYSYIEPGSEPVNGSVSDFDSYPKFDWYVGPNIAYSFFDPSDPLRADLQAIANGRVEVAPGLSITAGVGIDIVGNLADGGTASNSQLAHVRTDIDRYHDETDLGIYRLFGTYLSNPIPNVYAQVSGGLLEQMFAGVGGEVLYRPADSRLAFGAEAYYARQREFDTLLSLRDYDVVTGHASIYYDTPYQNWDVAVHAGRYLAEDWGTTFELARKFENGWEVGAFATFTDVPFSEFGEGSFDKGITLKVPFDWFLEEDKKNRGGISLRPIQRDGGQRLNIHKRLYDLTRDGSRGEIGSQWNTFAH